MEVVAGRGLMSAVGEEHKRMRKAMTPAFALPNLIARRFMTSTPTISTDLLRGGDVL